MMNLDEAIKHCEEVADFLEDNASRYDINDPFESHMACKDGECAKDHRQLAEWLKELKAYKEQNGDAISRQAVLDLPRQTIRNHFGGVVGDVVYVEDIKRLPSVSPQQMTGRWIPTSGLGYKCSECEGMDSTDLGYFCKWCGAKMEVEGCTKNI